MNASFLEDLPARAERLIGDPALCACLARNAAALMATHVTAEATAAYLWRLLTAWAALQSEGSRTEGFGRA